MKSPNLFNYEIRPCKFVERRMLLASLYQIVINMRQEYQYIGFGGLMFTDFKLFHKELSVNSMYSIEGGFTPEKLEFNKPFSCIKILHGLSTNMLLKIDLSKPSIVWLDYDGVLTMDVFTDINILFNSLPHGSVYIMSCNRQLQNQQMNPPRPYTNEEFEKLFNGLVPYDIEKNCCANINTSRTIKRMIDSYCHKIIEERNKIENTSLKYKSLYNIKYQERGGAKMFTCGGIIINKDYDEKQLYVNDSDYLNKEDPLEIDIPNLTRKEALYLNQILNIEEKEKEIVEGKIIKATDIEKYKKFYKYMPNYYDVRL